MKELRRNYSMSNPELMDMVGDFVGYMTRDAAEFAVRGVDAAAITAFEALGNAFEVFPPDEVYSAQITAEVDAKNAAREQSMIYARKITGFFEQQWGIDSWQYKQLAAWSLNSSSDSKFKAVCRNIVAMATENLTTLSAIGMTQTDIDNLEDEVQVMEDKGHAAALKKALRDSKTEERIEKGNELYGYLSKYAAVGKLIWEDVNESKYNDYIIYKTVHSGLSKPQNVSAVYDPLTPPNITLSWDAVSGATSYDVYYNDTNIGSPAGNFSLLDNFSSSPAAIPGLINRRFYFKIKAKNSESTSNYSDEVFVDVEES